MFTLKYQYEHFNVFIVCFKKWFDVTLKSKCWQLTRVGGDNKYLGNIWKILSHTRDFQKKPKTTRVYVRCITYASVATFEV